MKISVRFEGGLGDHILSNRFIPAIKEIHPESEIHLFSDTGGSKLQSEVLNSLFDYYSSTTLLKRASKDYRIMSQFGHENFPAHLNNIQKKQLDKMTSFDKFYNLHIDWLDWLDYDFNWQNYFSHFPAPNKKVKNFNHKNEYIILHVSSDNIGNNHRMSCDYIHNLIKKCIKNYDVFILSTPTTEEFVKNINFKSKNVHILREDIHTVIGACKECAGIFAIDSAIKYFGYTFNKPTLCWAQESKQAHSCPLPSKIRWLTFPALTFPKEYDHDYMWKCMSNLIQNNNNTLCPYLNEPELSQALVRRRVWA